MRVEGSKGVLISEEELKEVESKRLPVDEFTARHVCASFDVPTDEEIRAEILPQIEAEWERIKKIWIEEDRANGIVREYK